MVGLLKNKRNLWFTVIGLLFLQGTVHAKCQSKTAAPQSASAISVKTTALSPAPLYAGQEGGKTYGRLFDSPFTPEEKVELKGYAQKNQLSAQELRRTYEILERIEWSPNHQYYFFVEELLQRDRHFRNETVYEKNGWVYDPSTQISYSPFAQILLFNYDCYVVTNCLSCGKNTGCGKDFFVVN